MICHICSSSRPAIKPRQFSPVKATFAVGATVKSPSFRPLHMGASKNDVGIPPRRNKVKEPLLLRTCANLFAPQDFTFQTKNYWFLVVLHPSLGSARIFEQKARLGSAQLVQFFQKAHIEKNGKNEPIWGLFKSIIGKTLFLPKRSIFFSTIALEGHF